MSEVLFNPEEVAAMFNEQSRFDPNELLAEAKRRGTPEELELSGVFYGESPIVAGTLIFIQRGLVLFLGNGSRLDQVKPFRVYSGIVSRRLDPFFCYFERFRSGTERMCLCVYMDRVGNRPRTPHLRGLAGYMQLEMGRFGDEYCSVGFQEAMWQQITAKLDEYLIP